MYTTSTRPRNVLYKPSHTTPLSITSHTGDAEKQPVIVDDAVAIRDAPEHNIQMKFAYKSQMAQARYAATTNATRIGRKCAQYASTEVALRTSVTTSSSTLLIPSSESTEQAVNDQMQDQAIVHRSTVREQGNTNLDVEMQTKEHNKDHVRGQVHGIRPNDFGALKAFPASSFSSKTDFISLYRKGRGQAHVAVNPGYNDESLPSSPLSRNKKGTEREHALSSQSLRRNTRFLMAKMKAEEQHGLARRPPTGIGHLPREVGEGDEMEIEGDEEMTKERKQRVKKTVRFDLGLDGVRTAPMVSPSIVTVRAQTISQPQDQDHTPTRFYLHPAGAQVVAIGTNARPKARRIGTNARPSKARILSPSSDIENDDSLQSSSPTTAPPSFRAQKTLSPRNLPDASPSRMMLTPPSSPTTSKKRFAPDSWSGSNTERSTKKSKVSVPESVSEVDKWKERRIILQDLYKQGEGDATLGVEAFSNIALVMDQVVLDHKTVTLETILASQINKCMKRIAGLDLSGSYKDHPITIQIKKNAENVCRYWRDTLPGLAWR
ncbi:hypothetical protein FRB96_003631 [Tulasnella sp. 330]|nr:hypothetical protein FRB96_003631 [Tulasnella sp. 330]